MIDVATLSAKALAILDSGRGVAIATVVEVRGSAPRHLGARMLVASDGEQIGTIGGGKIEQVTVEAAREVAAGATPTVVRKHLIRDLAMCCGGSMEIAITPAAGSRAVLERLQGDRGHCDPSPIDPVVLLTPIEGEPLSLRPALPTDPPVHHPRVIDGVLVQRVGGGERAIIFGFGHVAKSVGPLLRTLGFEVIVCDDDETGALAAAPTWAARVIETFDAAEVDRLITFAPTDFLIIITRDHAVDQQILEYVIAKDLGYLGMIGSRGKVGRFKKRLEAKGLLEPNAERWAKLRAPIGLDLGAETPEEIAIAIAAELVAVRRRGGAIVGDWRVVRETDHT